MNPDIDNHEVSFADIPAEEQIKLLWAHNRYLIKQIRLLSIQLVPATEQVKLVQDRNRNLLEQMNRLTSQFEQYEKSDARLMEENEQLKTQLASCSQHKQPPGSPALRPTERKKIKSAGMPDPALSAQIAKFNKRYGRD